jgi:hypothetical protein
MARKAKGESVKLRVYVAGSSVERHDRAIPVIRALYQNGIEITHDWTIDMQNQSSKARSDADVPDDVRLQCSDDDLNAIRMAHYVLLLSPNNQGSSGAWTEFGYALGCGVPVIVTGAFGRRTIFTSKATRVFDLDILGVDWLIKQAARFQ